MEFKKITTRIFLIAIFSILVYHAYMSMIHDIVDVFNMGLYKLIYISLELISLLYIALNFKIVLSGTKFTKLFLLWLIFVLISCISFINIPSPNFLTGILPFILFCPLLYLTFFIYFSKNPENLSFGIFLFTALLIFLSIIYLSVYNTFNESLKDRYASIIIAYYLLLLLPWILLNKNSVIRYGCILIIVFSILYSMKRTGIIAMILALLPLFFLSRSKSGKKQNKVLAIFISLLFIGIIIYIMNYVNETTGGFLFGRFFDISYDKGSGRSDILLRMFEIQREASFIHWIFGHGHNQAVKHTGMFLSAHNDWLEVLFDYGVICFGIYVLIHVQLIKDLRFSLKNESIYTSALYSSYILFFVFSISSHLMIYPSYFIYLVTFWGAINGVKNSELLSLPEEDTTSDTIIPLK